MTLHGNCWAGTPPCYNPRVDTIVFATSNPGKLAEFREILSHSGLFLQILVPAELGIDIEPEECGGNFEDNAADKARTIAKELKSVTSIGSHIVVAEDSGLEVDVLYGWPGVNSKRVAPTDAERIRLLLDNLNGVPWEKRVARFVCCATVADDERVLFESRGEVEGFITEKPSGTGGFGYDPVFFYPPAGKTFAEMSLAEKAKVSHRKRALESLCEWLSESGFSEAD